jgi:hypothetical protein
VNIALYLERAARAFPDAPALAFGERVVADFATLQKRVAHLAGGLKALGLAPGDRVALAMKNSPAYFELFLAAWHGGFTVVPIHSKLHPKELGFIFDNCGAAVVFASANTLTSCEEGAALAPRVKAVIDVGSGAFAALYAAEPIALVPRTPADLEGEAWLIFDGTVRVDRARCVRGDDEVEVSLTGRFSTNSSEAIQEALRLGQGLCLAPYWLVAADLAAGRLERVLPQWRTPPALPIYAAYPETRAPTEKVRRFVDWLAESFEGDGLFARGP